MKGKGKLPAKSNPKIDKYDRGSTHFNASKAKHKGLRKTLEETKERNRDAASRNASAEILLPSEAGFIEIDGDNKREKIFHLKQRDIIQNVDLNSAKNAIDLQLTTFGPYFANYSRNGRSLLFAGRKGHVATLDCLRTSVGMELQLQEEIHDVHYLHNDTMFAVAQNKYTYIYDNKGVEIHCMKRHERPFKLDFLPYHFLLTSIGHSGWIKWHDVSIGMYISGYQTGHGPCKVLKHNPVNAVSHVGHSNGVISLWSPSAGKSLASMFCHKAPITDLAIDREGKYMATTGLDGYLKVWDLRKFTALHSYKLDQPGVSVDISDRGLIGVGLGRQVQVLRNAFTQPMDVTYLSHSVRTPNDRLSGGAGVTAAAKALLSSVKVSSVRFRPLEDVLCIGHSHGLSTMLVPGAGEPNYDSFENNPFINSRQRREAEVQGLMDKLSHEMIGLDASFVGSVEKDRETLVKEQNALFQNANKKELDKKDKKRARGKNKIGKQLRRKQKNVVDAQLLKLQDKKKQMQEEREKLKGGSNGGSGDSNSSGMSALSRFVKK